MRTLFITMALVAMALAGCADDAAPVQDDESTAVDDQVKATSTTGVIRGVVVDNAIVPIEGATVTIKSLELETTSLADGSFGFSDLDPGNYFLDVSKVGFDKVQASASVEAGVDKPPIVRVQLTEDPGSLPTVETLVFEGFIQCSVVTPVVRAAVCAVPGIVGIDLGDDFITYFDIDEPDFIQSELLWDSTQPAGDNLALQNYGGRASADGPSPLMLALDKEYVAGNQVSENRFSFRVFAGWIDGTGNPVTGWGVGATIEQDFDMYINIFTNTVPTEGWMFSEDGAYEP